MYVTVIVLAAALGLVLSVAAGKKAFQKDDRMEDIKKGYIEVAMVLRKYGLKHIPELLINRATNDFSGMHKKILYFVELLRQDPEAVVKEFDQVFGTVLTEKLKDPAQVALLKAQIADAEKV